eukprot:3636340-Prymnesium_polylepis.1
MSIIRVLELSKGYFYPRGSTEMSATVTFVCDFMSVRELRPEPHQIFCQHSPHPAPRSSSTGPPPPSLSATP